jgi:hypothetical protein
MRQLLVQVPRGHGADALASARAHDGVNLARVEASDGERPVDLAIVHVSNDRVESLVGALERLPELRVTLVPQGVMALRPPAAEATEQVLDVEARSPIEVFLAGLQSVGSWRGFLSYAAGAGVVVWIGLFTNTAYLLVAAPTVRAATSDLQLNGIMTCSRNGARSRSRAYQAATFGSVGRSIGSSW